MLGRLSRLGVRCSALLVALSCAGAEAPAKPEPKPEREREIEDVPETPPAVCVRRDPLLRVFTESDPAVLAGTAVTYMLAITNQNEPSCEPEVFLGSVTPPIDGLGFRVEPLSVDSAPLAGGETVEVPIAVSSGADEDDATYALSFFVRTQQRAGLEQVHAASAEASYVVLEPEGCHVVPSRELLIRHLSVVDDATRTVGDGAWTFGRMMRRIASRAEDAPALAEAMFQSFSSPQMVNGFRVAARPGMGPSLLQPWPKTSAGELDLVRAPMRLLAIAHRLDLPDLDEGRAGEGRFVFGAIDRNGGPMLFTIIFEFALPASNEAELRAWAHAVHALADSEFPSAEYNDALQLLTDRYTTREALLRIRTNENSLGRDGRWEMREFHLSAETGSLVPAALAQTPDVSLNGSARLARYIEENRASILRENHATPAMLEDAPFAAGALLNELDFWQAPGIDDSELRHKFSINTCDGCHGGETLSSFFHVLPRPEGMQSRLSGFLTGGMVRDPVSGEERNFNELARRRQLLERSVCPK